MRPGKMAQLVKYKHDNLSLDHQCSCKSWVWWLTTIIQGRKGGRTGKDKNISRACHSRKKKKKMSPKFSVRPCVNKVEMEDIKQ